VKFTLLLEGNVPSTGERTAMKKELLEKRKKKFFLPILSGVPGNFV